MTKQEISASVEQRKERRSRKGVSSAFIDRIISAQKNINHALKS